MKSKGKCKFVTAQCNKCNGRVIFDIGVLSKEEVIAWMEKTEFGHCRTGWHVECGTMASYYIVDWTKICDTQEEAEKYNLEKAKMEKVA